MTKPLLELDGSYGEGGGQILRTSLALSLLTGRPFHLRHIRARRSKPGLQPQHLTCVRAAATIGQADTRGASVGSTDLVFEPGEIRSGSYRFDIGTAGATSLVLHTLYLPLAFGRSEPSEVTLIGGTHVTQSPCFHFLEVTWRAYLERLGLRIRLQMNRPGFYPRGGGEVIAHLQPSPRLNGLPVRPRGDVSITGFSAVAGLPEHIARRQARRAENRLKNAGYKAVIQQEQWSGGPGSVLALTVQVGSVPTLFFGLGARGKPAEKVADEAVDQVIPFLQADPSAVDPHSADQIVLPLALAEGPSEIPTTEMTEHLRTNVAIIRHFVERDIICEGDLSQPGRVYIS